VENKPETPKEAPPLPHSEQKKINDQEAKDKSKEKDKSKDKAKVDGKTAEDISGLEVRKRHFSRAYIKKPGLTDSLVETVGSAQEGRRQDAPYSDFSEQGPLGGTEG
jgi:hypothetical protein